MIYSIYAKIINCYSYRTHRFWFIILATISGVAVLYSLVVIMMPTTRETIIKRSYRSGQRKEIAGLVRRLEVSLNHIYIYT